MLSNLPGSTECGVKHGYRADVFYRRGESRHKPLMLWLAWLLMLLYAFAPLCYLCGRFDPVTGWSS
ncbi:phage holin family protein [Escherichia coli]